jgi:predicted GTPase
MVFRNNPEYRVVAFTATQIPEIHGRRYPAELAGDLYPDGIPVLPEEELGEIMREQEVDLVVFAYSDVSHDHVMHRASIALAGGADFILLGPRTTCLKASVPVISVCAVRTGAGKSPASRRIAWTLKSWGYRVAVVRHPMPYGDLRAQRAQRFASYDDLDKYGCTIEEREEYEPHLERGIPVFAGVDYGEVLAMVQAEARIIVWDGGNNDLPFFWPDLHVVVVDPLRPGHEVRYHPGEANLRMAQVVIVSKQDVASPEAVAEVKANVARVNPAATVIDSVLKLSISPELPLEGKRVLAIEDGPTVTHGEMGYGAAYMAAIRSGALPVDPRPYAVGSIAQAYRQYPHMKEILPALGYSPEQIRELRASVEHVPCDLVLAATPVDLSRLFGPLPVPVVRVKYEMEDVSEPTLPEVLRSWLDQRGIRPA